jgi:hypothetical protein
MADTRGPSTLWWAAPAAGILILMALAMVVSPPEDHHQARTSYDASPEGIRAAYLLLEELDYPVTRSRRPVGEAVRWVLFPAPAEEKTELVDAWVQQGGILVLAADAADFGRSLGLALTVQQEHPDPGAESATGGGVSRLNAGPTRVTGPTSSGQVWATAGGRPVVTIYPKGRGEIWLVNRPEFLTNKLLARDDNAVLLCRMAEATLDRHPGKLAVDEYVHGLRDRPGFVELLLRPPTLWVTLQGLLLAALVLWHAMPRFGAVIPSIPARRRSKEEFLDAMASLLERKGDYAEAFRTARDEFAHEIERELGLPATTDVEVLLAEAVRRRSVAFEPLRRALTGAVLPPKSGQFGFLKALNELETTRERFFRGRSPR